MPTSTPAAPAPAATATRTPAVKTAEQLATAAKPEAGRLTPAKAATAVPSKAYSPKQMPPKKRLARPWVLRKFR